MKLFVTAALAVVLAAGCSTAPPIPKTVAAPLPASIVPNTLPSDKLTLQEDLTKDIQQAVVSAGPQLLASDVKFWEIHAGSRLVGALQLATLKSLVDTSHAADRDNIISQILLGPSEEIDIGGLPVWTTPSGAGGTPRAIFIFFGDHDFGVLQLQSQDLNSSQVANDLITEVANQPAWHALPPEAYQGQ